jgi:hypothetical protein
MEEYKFIADVEENSEYDNYYPEYDDDETDSDDIDNEVEEYSDEEEILEANLPCGAEESKERQRDKEDEDRQQWYEDLKESNRRKQEEYDYQKHIQDSWAAHEEDGEA